MPAAGVVLLITVVLIVLALVYYLVVDDRRPAPDRRGPRRDDRRGRRDHREDRAGRGGRHDHQRSTSTRPSTRSRACSSRRPGWRTPSASSTACTPAPPRPGSATSRRAATIKAPRISEVYTRGHADARPARPRGADRRREPGRRTGAAQRRPAAASRRARSTRRTRQTRPERLSRSPVIGTDAPVQYEPSADRRPRRMPTTKGRQVQTPAPFDYERATSVEGAIASLRRLGGEARIIAGGHSLLPMMKLRLATPAHLIDINDLAELAYIREEGDELAIGALTRHVELLESELLAAALPRLPRRRAGDRRPGRAQPRHDRRLALPGRRGRGPLRRLRRAQGQGRDPRRGRRARRPAWASSTSARG